jgi:hypothetical protein
MSDKGADLPEKATLHVARTLDRDIKFRDLILLLDGEEIGRLAFGKSLSLEIEPGEHTIQGTNTMVRSQPVAFVARPGERINFNAGNDTKGCLSIFAFFLVIPPRAFVEPA